MESTHAIQFSFLGKELRMFVNTESWFKMFQDTDGTHYLFRYPEAISVSGDSLIIQ
jgi:hypothetical protein